MFKNDREFAKSPETLSVDNSTSDSFNVKDWVVVRYDEKAYPGEIVKVVEDSYEVSVMHQKFGVWKWPARPDCILYEKKDIVKKINEPIPVGRRGEFTFDDI